jgi:hypothetical protein
MRVETAGCERQQDVKKPARANARAGCVCIGWRARNGRRDALVWLLYQILRKEVIQPQVPLRLPCYDLVPITELILGACLLAVDTATLDAPRFRGLTGGVYKAQEHIHRSIADLRLLAIPASCRRIAACNLNWGTLFEICSRSRVCFPLYAPL